MLDTEKTPGTRHEPGAKKNTVGPESSEVNNTGPGPGSKEHVTLAEFIDAQVDFAAGLRLAELSGKTPETPLNAVLSAEIATAVARWHMRMDGGLALNGSSDLGDFTAIPVAFMKRWLPGDFDARADAKRWNHETSYPDPHEWVKVQKNVSAGLAATAAEAQRLKLAKAKAIEERPRLWSADDLSDPQRQEWLATGHVPKSAVTLLVGDEGIGKSLWWVWLCGYITTGNSCPEFGIPAREPAHVILVVTEDDWSTTVRPRLDVAGVDRAYVHVLCEAKDGSGSPTFPDDMGEIENAPFTPALIVVDAWLDTVPAKWSVRDPQQARLALHPWKDLATRTGAAVLLLTHTNRANTANARDKYGATAELRKKARMTLFAQADSDDDTCMIVGPEKSNIALAAKATRFRKVPKDHFDPTDDNDGTVPLLEYVGLEDKSSRELIAEAFHGPEDDESDERTDAEEAEEWLVDFLSEVNEVGKRGKPKTEPVPGKTVRDAARAAGIKEHTLKRAAKKIGVIYSKAGFPATNHWSLDDLSFDPETLPPVVRGSDPFNDHSD